MFKVSPASLQTIIDTPNCVLEDRVQYSTVHIPNVFCDGSNANYVIMVSDGNSFKIFLRIFCTLIIRCTEAFLSPCMLQVGLLGR
jgi:hypothetical protein